MESTDHDIHYLVRQSFETAAVPGTKQLPDTPDLDFSLVSSNILLLILTFT